MSSAVVPKTDENEKTTPVKVEQPKGYGPDGKLTMEQYIRNLDYSSGAVMRMDWPAGKDCKHPAHCRLLTDINPYITYRVSCSMKAVLSHMLWRNSPPKHSLYFFNCVKPF